MDGALTLTRELLDVLTIQQDYVSGLNTMSCFIFYVIYIYIVFRDSSIPVQPITE